MQTDNSCRKLLLEFFSHLNCFVFHGYPRTVMGCPLWDQVTPILRDVLGLSWDVPCGILRTPSHTNIEGRPRTVLGCPSWDCPDIKLEGCPRTVLGCPSWDCPDIKLLQLGRMSQDSPGMSLMGSSGHQLRLACSDVPGQSQISLLYKPPEIKSPQLGRMSMQGQSWDVPHGILRTSCHPSLQGCPRTVLGCLISRIVQRCPGRL